MKRSRFFIVAALLFMQFLCSPTQASDEVTKSKDIGFKPNWNVGTNPVEVFHEDGSRTISIAFNRQSDDIRVKIIKDGKLVVDDKETADRSTVIGYTFAGTDAAQCSVVVETEGVRRLADTVEIGR